MFSICCTACDFVTMEEAEIKAHIGTKHTGGHFCWSFSPFPCTPKTQPLHLARALSLIQGPGIASVEEKAFPEWQSHLFPHSAEAWLSLGLTCFSSPSPYIAVIKLFLCPWLVPLHAGSHLSLAGTLGGETLLSPQHSNGETETQQRQAFPSKVSNQDVTPETHSRIVSVPSACYSDSPTRHLAESSSFLFCYCQGTTHLILQAPILS
jgi:hypothetical protein